MNKKGFTLVEIIVSIAIASIVLAVMGSLIISSTHLLYSSTQADLDKRAIEETIDVVRDDIENAQDVRLMQKGSTGAPSIDSSSQWHILYVKDGNLYRDNKALFSDDYYSQKELHIQAKGNVSKQVQIDFIYSLMKDGETDYTSQDTITFLNVSTSNEIITNPLYFATSSVDLEESSYVLYYKSGQRTVTIEDNKGSGDTTIPDWGDGAIGDGTVADQKELLTLLDYRPQYTNVQYHRGDVVYYEGKLWLYNSSQSGGDVPGNSATFWKCLDSQWIQNSKYSLGDIVIHNGKYYKLVVEYGWNPAPDNPDHHPWQEITKEEAQQKQYVMPRREYTEADKKRLNAEAKSVASKLLNLVGYQVEFTSNEAYYKYLQDYQKFIKQISEYNDDLRNTYPVLGTNNPTKPSDFVKITTDVNGVTYERYFYRVYGNVDAAPDESDVNGKFAWQEVALYFHEKSVYLKGDITYAKAGGNSYYHSFWQATQNVIDDEMIQTLKNSFNYDFSFQANDEKFYNEYIYPTGWYASGAGHGVIWKRYEE